MIALPTLAVGSGLAVARHRGHGVGASILLGWVILYAVYNLWPAPTTEWDEDREEIYYMAPILMAIWCLPVWGVVEVWHWLKRKRGAQI